MDFIWVLIAFSCGFAARLAGLPPLVGYLFAGFALNASGVQVFNGLEQLTNIGITLLLFTIGLKIKPSNLVKPAVWGGAISHNLIWILIFAGLLFIGTLVFTINSINITTILLLGFALSFSSTVCVMKAFEENSELKTRHSNLSIGVLVIQDILAVTFLAIAAGNLPNYWALTLVLIPVIRPLLHKILNLSGHGELLVLVGFFMALGGPEIFKLMGIKGDLGALLIGMMLANSPKSNELYKSLSSFKDLFLIGFFLTIGFSALPTWETFGFALLLVALLPIKMMMFFFIFIYFGMRARTALLSSLALMNFSEFGLIVANYSVENGWFNEDILVILAIAVSVSFVISTLLYNHAHQIYTKLHELVSRFERSNALVNSGYESPKDAEVLIVGMGRVGGGAYHALQSNLNGKVWGVEADEERAKIQKEQGMQVVFGDADDIDFWQQLDFSSIQLIMLAIPSITEMKNILMQLKQTKFNGKIAAIAHFDDEKIELEDLGAHIVFNYYAEVGTGFAEECTHLTNNLAPASNQSDEKNTS